MPTLTKSHALVLIPASVLDVTRNLKGERQVSMFEGRGVDSAVGWVESIEGGCGT